MEIEAAIRAMVPEEEGCIHGIADLGGLTGAGYAAYPFGVALGKKLDDGIIDSIREGPNAAYHRHYEKVNGELGALAAALSEALNAMGIRSVAVAPTMSDSEIEERHRATLSADFPHKTAATRAGLGWIGKTGLLISNRFGPRLRLATVLTECPPGPVAAPVRESRCGDCRICVEACPAGAANGRSWTAGDPRERFYDAFRCRETCRALTRERVGIDTSLCGICVAVCPVGTRRPGNMHGSSDDTKGACHG